MAEPGLTTILGADANTPPKLVPLLAGSDGTNVSPGHTPIDVDGVPFGTPSNPFSVEFVGGDAYPVADVAAEAALGTAADSAWPGTGPGSVIAALKGLYVALKGTLTATLTGPLPPGGNAIGSVSVTNFPPTQPVSGAVSITGTVPVADAAAETSLATIATQTTAEAAATGTAADAAYTAGSGSVVALLKGLYVRLAGTLAVTGTFWQATQPVSGTVAVSNFPATQPVSGTVAVSGTVPVADAAAETLLATIATEATAAATAAGTAADAAWGGTGNSTLIAALKAIYARLAGTLTVSGTFWQATQPVSGTVAVSNLPGTQPVSGTVAISGTVPVSDSAAETSLATIVTETTAVAGATGTTADAAYSAGSGSVIALLKGLFSKLSGTLAVSGTFWQATQPVSGTVAVGNFPGTQAVSGTFFQATQPVSGAVSISGTAAVSLAALPALVAGSAAIGTVGVTALPPLPAGTNAIGSVSAGGYTSSVSATPTVQAAAYAINNVVGGLLTLAAAARSAGTGLIQAVTASFVSGVLPSLDVIFFNASPTSSTITDKTAVAVATADLGKIIGIAHLTDSTLVGTTAPSFVQAEQQAIPFLLPSGTTIYAAVVTRTAMTLTSTSDMILTARFLQD